MTGDSQPAEQQPAWHCGTIVIENNRVNASGTLSTLHSTAIHETRAMRCVNNSRNAFGKFHVGATIFENDNEFSAVVVCLHHNEDV